MQCPRCGQPTHVIASRTKGVAVRRQRGCGQLKHGKMVTTTCGAKFWTVEVPVGFKVDVSVKMTPKGFEAEVKK